MLFPRLREAGGPAQRILDAELDRVPPPRADEGERERLAKRQANAAVALLRLGRPARVWPMLGHSADPGRRSHLIHRLSPLGADPGVVCERLGRESDVSVRRALLLCLGEWGPDRIPDGQRGAVTDTAGRLYLTDPDPGVHGAAEWLLRRWGRADRIADARGRLAAERDQRLGLIGRLLAGAAGPAGDPAPVAQPQWYVNGEGQTMVAVPGPVEFWMGSPATEADRQPYEQRHRRRVGRTFAVAAHHVTVDQFERFRGDRVIDPGHGIERDVAPSGDCPAHLMTWYAAAAYCNWLSAREGLPASEWCFEPAPGGTYGPGMRLAPGYLRRTGYRLPTEAEWEYACRAGAEASRFFGQSDELVGKYGWAMANSGRRTWPVGSLKPNDLGLFDLYGNVHTWCLDRYRDYPEGPGGAPIDDGEGLLAVDPLENRVLRGHTIRSNPLDARSADRSRVLPSSTNRCFGFLVARTVR